jgi:hypothetical protein
VHEVKKISDISFNKYEIVKRIEKMITSELVICYNDALIGSALPFATKTIEDIVQLKYANWQLSGMFRDVSDMRSSLAITAEDIVSNTPDDDTILMFLQYAANCVQYASDVCNDSFTLLGLGNKIKFLDKDYASGVFRLIDILLDSMNAGRVFNESTKEVSVFSKNALSEIVLSEVPDVLQVTRQYKSLAIKGNLIRKEEIICTLYKEFEKIRKIVKTAKLTDLESETGMIMNFARHEPKNNAIAMKFHSLSNGEKEKWYDEAYNMFVACFSLLPYIKIKQNIDELKKI